MEDLTGRQFGPYRIITPLGEGGMAVVYKAYQPNIDRYVALKILPSYFARDPQFVGRFQQEARLLANLQHVNILPVHDFGESDGYTYIVMPFIETGTLGELLDERPLPLATIERIIAQVASALDYAHSRGIVHRDIKPNNILINLQGDCLLTDFGIAKIVEGTSTFTQMGGTLGTPTYMSPEQIHGEKLDGRSDVYSLGIVLYEMATGRPPFRAETPPALFVKHLHDPLPPPHLYNPDLPEGVERVILKALAKDRDDRFETAGALAVALAEALSTRPTEEQRAVPRAEEKPSAPRKRKVVPETEPAIPIPPKRTPVPEIEPAVRTPPKRTPVPATEPAMPAPPSKMEATELGGPPGPKRRIPAWAIGIIVLVVVGGLAAGLVSALRPPGDQVAQVTSPPEPTVTVERPEPTATVEPPASPTAKPQPAAQVVPSPTTVAPPTEAAPVVEPMPVPVVVRGGYASEEGQFAAMNARFTELTGIEVLYEGAPGADALLQSVQDGTEPDVAFIPQAGPVRPLVQSGAVVPLWPEIIDAIRANYAPVWLELGSYDGTPFVVFQHIGILGLVWYPRQPFEAAGYQVPRTWDELIGLSEQIVADGRTPWCVGSRNANDEVDLVTTNWIEDILLRTAGPEVYDLWSDHRIPFLSDPLFIAGEHVAQIWFSPGSVRGGRESILTEQSFEGPLALWDDPPGCYLVYQNTHRITFWPDEVLRDLDRYVGVIPFPAINEEWGRPLIVYHGQAVMFHDRPEVRAYMEYLASGQSGEPWARAGRTFLPQRDQDFAWYPSELERGLAQLLLDTEIIRLDASDLMPPEVGGDAFPVGMVDWIAGAPLEDILARIDASWPGEPDAGRPEPGCEDPIGCVHIEPGEPIHIGAILALSGPQQPIGLDAQRGLELAVQDRGEILGHPIEFVIQDSSCTEEGGERAAAELSADPRLVAIVGPSCTRAARAAMPIICSAHVPLVSPSATAPDLAGGDRPGEFQCFFRTAPDDMAQGVVAAEYARETLGVTRAATIHDTSINGRLLAEAFADRFRRLGGEITAQEVVEPDGAGAGPALERIAASGVELIFYPVFEGAGGQITAQARSMEGLQGVQLMGAGTLFTPDLLASAGEAAAGVYWAVTDTGALGPAYEPFVAQYEESYGEPPISPFHAHAYDAAQLLFRAVEKAGIAGADGRLLIGRQALLEALYAARGYEGLTGVLNCRPNGDCAETRVIIYQCTIPDPDSWNPGPTPTNNPRQVWP